VVLAIRSEDHHFMYQFAFLGRTRNTVTKETKAIIYIGKDMIYKYPII
jgi:hypothetical protein